MRNLTDFQYLSTIGGSLIIEYNDSLPGLYGFENLDTIGGDLEVNNNGVLTDFSGLEELSDIGDDLKITFNDSLISLNGLDSLTSLGGWLFIQHNPSLLNMHALKNLTSIGQRLNITYNDKLDSLEGLQNIDPLSIMGLYIYYNPSLSMCHVESICEYLMNPEGSSIIHDNKSGCNSVEEVKTICLVSTEDMIGGNSVTLFPNPFISAITVEYELQQPEKVTLTISDGLGRIIKTIYRQPVTGKQKLVINTKGLPSGIYYYKLQAGEQVYSGKMIKVK